MGDARPACVTGGTAHRLVRAKWIAAKRARPNQIRLCFVTPRYNNSALSDDQVSIVVKGSLMQPRHTELNLTFSGTQFDG